MNFSKKELSIFIEIAFSILFAIFFLPYFYDNRFETYDLNNDETDLIYDEISLNYDFVCLITNQPTVSMGKLTLRELIQSE